jgi:transcriptional regulator with XRE-family HTH domain
MDTLSGTVQTTLPAELGAVLRRRRLEIPLTLQELADRSGISVSHIGRIERGERFPSAKVLLRLACHLQYEENELFALAGYLTPPESPGSIDASPADRTPRLDPQVARILAREPVEVQRSVVSPLAVVKNTARHIKCGESDKQSLP